MRVRDLRQLRGDWSCCGNVDCLTTGCNKRLSLPNVFYGVMYLFNRIKPLAAKRIIIAAGSLKFNNNDTGIALSARDVALVIKGDVRNFVPRLPSTTVQRAVA